MLGDCKKEIYKYVKIDTNLQQGIIQRGKNKRGKLKNKMKRGGFIFEKTQYDMKSV